MRTPFASTLASLSSILAVALALAAPACSDDGGAPPIAPAIIPGGGVHDPGIDGVANVYVIDADDGAPLAGATVRVGDLEGTTDATGLFVAAGASGPQTILAKATGHAAAAWIGVDGANVTIPLDRSPPDTTKPPQAQLTGTIEGWAALPSPDVNHALVAVVSYAQDRELGARANQIQQPTSTGPIPASACARGHGPAGTCAWKLNARAGAIALGLVVYDIDNRGTVDTGDDATIVTGFAVEPITVVAGMNQMGVTMPLPAPDSTVRPTVDLGTPPPALTQLGSIIGLDLGAAGVLRFAGIDPTRAGAVIPSLSIAAGATYELLAVAREPVADGTAADSIVLRRGVTDPSLLAAGAWLPPPTALSGNRTMVSFTRGRADGLYVATLANAGLGVEGRPVMSLVFFDGSSQAALPVDFAPLPGDPLTLKVTGLDTAGALDLRDFTIDDVTARLSAAASDTIPVP